MRVILACYVLCLGLTCVQSNIFEQIRKKYYCQFLPSGCNHGALPAVAQKQGETELVKLLKKADLNGALSDPKATYTLFAPSNEAFNKLPRGLRNAIIHSKPFLTKVLKYHVIEGKALSSDLKNDLLIPTLSGKPIRVNVYKNNTVFTVSGRQINKNKLDIAATNGILHEIEGVMMPPSGSIVKSISGCPKIKTLTSLLKKANLVNALSGDGPFTVFTPMDSAFEKLPKETIDILLGNITLLQDVLKYHVVSGTFYSVGLSNEAVPTLSGKSVSVQIGTGGIILNNKSKVISPDVSVTNGVLHAIDTVLMPPSIQALMSQYIKTNGISGINLNP